MKARSRRSLLLTALVAGLLGAAPLTASADDGGMLGSGTRTGDGTTAVMDGGMLGSGTRTDGGAAVEPTDEERSGYLGSGNRDGGGGTIGSGT